MKFWTKNSIRGNRPLLKSDIEAAQAVTISGAQAARFLRIDYETYKRYAKMYEIFDKHKNQSGVGVRKGGRYDKGKIPIQDILDNKYPFYDSRVLKKRLIASARLEEVCDNCGFSERRVTDYQVPLILVMKDGNPHNFAFDNLKLLCYNCTFITTTMRHNTIMKPETQITEKSDVDVSLSADEIERIQDEIRNGLSKEDSI